MGETTIWRSRPRPRLQFWVSWDRDRDRDFCFRSHETRPRPRLLFWVWWNWHWDWDFYLTLMEPKTKTKTTFLQAPTSEFLIQNNKSTRVNITSESWPSLSGVHPKCTPLRYTILNDIFYRQHFKKDFHCGSRGTETFILSLVRLTLRLRLLFKSHGTKDKVKSTLYFCEHKQMNVLVGYT